MHHFLLCHSGLSIRIHAIPSPDCWFFKTPTQGLTSSFTKPEQAKCLQCKAVKHHRFATRQRRSTSSRVEPSSPGVVVFTGNLKADTQWSIKRKDSWVIQSPWGDPFSSESESGKTHLYPRNTRHNDWHHWDGPGNSSSPRQLPVRDWPWLGGCPCIQSVSKRLGDGRLWVHVYRTTLGFHQQDCTGADSHPVPVATTPAAVHVVSIIASPSSSPHAHNAVAHLAQYVDQPSQLRTTSIAHTGCCPASAHEALEDLFNTSEDVNGR